jgi:alpha-1,3-mannosyltransferase
MQQVELFLHGQRNYLDLKGTTGPCVYPAGFLYFFSLIYLILDGGVWIGFGQYVFCFVMSLQTMLTTRVYQKTNTSHVVFLILFSKRIHSINVLRMFNDPIAMLFLYSSLVCILYQKWNWAAVFYSIGLSIKMNLLLYSPGMALIYYQSRGIIDSLVSFFIVIFVQLVLAIPFWNHLDVYFKSAFDFSRTFLYTWSVNWKMIPENIFYQSWFSLLLLFVHVVVLGLFLFKWCRYYGGISSVVVQGFAPIQKKLSNECRYN